MRRAIALTGLVLFVLGLVWCPVLGPPPHPIVHDAVEAGERLSHMHEPRRSSSAFSYGRWSGNEALDNIAARGAAVPPDLRGSFFHGILTRGVHQVKPPAWTAGEVEELIPPEFRMYLHSRAIHTLSLAAAGDAEKIVSNIARYAVGVSSIPLGKSLVETLLGSSPDEPWIAYRRAGQFPQTHWAPLFETIAAELGEDPDNSWADLLAQTPQGATCYAAHGFLRGRVHRIAPTTAEQWQQILDQLSDLPSSCYPKTWRGLCWGLLSSPFVPKGKVHMELIEEIALDRAREEAKDVFKQLGTQPSPLLLPWAHYMRQDGVPEDSD